MKLQVLAVRDRAADAFNIPAFVPAIGQAVRSFSDQINQAPQPGNPNPLSEHPEDFDLYLLGTYDDSNGHFEAIPPRQVAVGKDLKRSV